MALSAKSGMFMLNASTGNQSITGVGFTPKVIIFFSGNMTGDGVGDDNIICIGAVDDSGNQRVICCTDEDGQGTTDSSRVWDNDEIIKVLFAGSTSINFEANWVSMDADGFTINVGNAPGAQRQVGYWALGGSDLVNVDVDNFSASTSTGNQTISGVGFTPNALMVFSANTDQSAGTAEAEDYFCMGITDGTSEFCTAIGCGNGESTSETAKGMWDSYFMVRMNKDEGLPGDASFSSFNADGFVLNYSDAYPSPYVYMYVAMDVTNVACGDVDSRASNGTISETGLGFEPNALFLLYNCHDGGYGTGIDAYAGTGACGSAVADNLTFGGLSEDSQGTTDTRSYRESDEIVVRLNEATGAVENLINLDSYDADGFTLDQTQTTDVSTFKIAYLALGGTPSTDVAIMRRRREMIGPY